jgi:hypothetical protein
MNAVGILNCTSCGASLAAQDTGPSHQLPRGTLLKQNQYEILDLLGEGGFGISLARVLLSQQLLNFA